MIKTKYNFTEYLFLAKTCHAIGYYNGLMNLPASDELLKRETDQSSEYHKRFYANFDKYLAENYVRFISEVIYPMFGEPILYQRVPSFRIQLPNNLGVGEFHRDRDYGHNPKEINFFVPLTDAINTSTIWVDDGTGKYEPLNAVYGEVVQFDGANMLHGNKVNITGKSRVSFDFRVIRKSEFVAEKGKSSINTNLKFDIGGYFELMDNK